MYSAKHNTYIVNYTQFHCMFLFQWTTFRPVLNIQTWCIQSARTLWDPYCLQTSLILKFKLKSIGRYIFKIYKNIAFSTLENPYWNLCQLIYIYTSMRRQFI